MPCASDESRPAISKLKGAEWLDADFLAVNPWLREAGMSLNAPVKLFHAERPKNPGESWNLCGAIRRNPQHRKGSGIVAEQERTANAGPPGKGLIAEGNLPAAEIKAGVG